jgi:glucose-6-phosphate 1-dehydrogenase
MLPWSSNLARYRESFAAPSPDACETLLWSAMKNDATLFVRADQVASTISIDSA